MQNKYILMLENDSDDRYITQSTLEELGIAVPVRYEFYFPNIADTLEQVPAIILLAYNTAPDNGIGIVKHFKSNPRYRKVPIILLIEGLSQDDIARYYEAGVNTVIRKPFRETETRKKIAAFFTYWFEVAEL